MAAVEQIEFERKYDITHVCLNLCVCVFYLKNWKCHFRHIIQVLGLHTSQANL